MKRNIYGMVGAVFMVGWLFAVLWAIDANLQPGSEALFGAVLFAPVLAMVGFLLGALWPYD